MAVLLSLSAKEKLHALHINILTTSFFLSSYKMLLFSFLFCLFVCLGLGASDQVGIAMPPELGILATT